MASADTCFSVEVKIGAKSSLEQVVKYALLEKSKMNNKLTSAELEAASRSMQVAHITFARFHEITKIYAGSISPGERYADSTRKLIDGLLHELEFRSHPPPKEAIKRPFKPGAGRPAGRTYGI